MDKTCNISIIIPVYNAESTIEKCINSIQNQKYGNWEIILINDGSTDGSLECCKKLEMSDCRIKVIDKSNGGVSSARNFGLELAEGDWITFIDSDDYVENDFFSHCKSEYADLLICDYKRKAKDSIKHVKFENEFIDLTASSDKLTDIISSEVFLCPWTKFFRRSIIEKFKIRFDPEIKWAEDRLFVYEYLSHISNLKFVGSGNYIYNLPEGNMSILKYHITIPMIIRLRDRIESFASDIKIKNPECLFYNFWLTIEEYCLLSDFSHIDRKKFYKDHKKLSSVFSYYKNRSKIHVFFYYVAALFPYFISKYITRFYLTKILRLPLCKK